MNKEEAKLLVKDTLTQLKARKDIPKEYYVQLLLGALRNRNFLVYCPITGLPLRDVQKGEDGILNYIV